MFTKKLYTAVAPDTTPERAFTTSGSPVSFTQFNAGLQNSNALNSASFTPPRTEVILPNEPLFCPTADLILLNAETPKFHTFLNDDISGGRILSFIHTRGTEAESIADTTMF